MTDDIGSWLPERPLEFPQEDAFGVDGLIDQLVEQLVAAQPPFAVSLSGSWGVGKSTVAQEVVKRLRKRDVRCILVDAWTLDVRHLRRHLVVEVGAALGSTDRRADPDPRKRAEFALRIDTEAAQTVEQFAAKVELRKPREIADAVAASPVSLLVIALAVVLIVAGGLAWKNASSFLFTIAGVLALGWLTTYVLKITTPSRSRAATAEDVVLANTFAATVSRKPSRLRLPFVSEKPDQIVIVVDNLDRLSGQDALDALSQIRALLDVPRSRCVFVIPIDRDKLEDHLRRGLGGQIAAADYLEKFFGLDLALTQPEPVDLRRWAQRKAKELLRDIDDVESARLADVVVSAASRSPRAITRLINGAVTRHRVVTALGQKLDLPQAALIESVLQLAPDLLGALEANPRRFITVRTELGGMPQAQQLEAVAGLVGVSPVKQEASVEPGPGQPGQQWPRTVVDLHRFLVRQRSLPLTWEQVRVALALRENRLWVGVSDWDAFQQPISDGNVDAFAEALASRAEERDTVIRHATEAVIETGGPAVPMAHGLNVLTPHFDPPPAKAAELRQLALEAFEHDSLGFPLLTEQAAVFVLGDGKVSHRLSESLTLAAETTDTPEGSGLSRAALIVQTRLTDQQMDRLRKRMATWPLVALGPIFEDEAGVAFVDGPVGTALVERLVGWTPASSDHDEIASAADALRRAVGNGWTDQGSFDRVAAQLSAQAPSIAADPESQPIGDALVALLSATAAPSPAVDSLAQVLAQDFPPAEAPFMRWAWRMPLTPAGESTLVTRFDQWAQSAPIEKVGEVLDENRQRLDQSASTYRAVLFARWQTTGDQVAAILGLADDPESSQQFVAAWRAVDGANSLARARTAFEILNETGTKEDSLLLANALPDLAPQWPADLGGLDQLVAWMKGHQITRDPLVDGLAARARNSASAADLDQLILALDPILDTFGANQVRTIADELTTSLERLSIHSPEAVGAAVSRASTAAPRENVAVSLVEAGLDLDRTLAALDRMRAPLHRSSRVFEALVGRAVRESAADNAAADLREAVKWKRPPKNAPSEVEANLSAVETTHPDLKDLVKEIRG